MIGHSRSDTVEGGTHIGAPTMEAKAREVEEQILLSPSKEEALKKAILATEVYMKAIKLAISGSERERLRSRCMEVLAKAEEIKQVKDWNVLVNRKIQVRTSQEMAPPLSSRALSTREQVILLESSKLHGFVFSPWTHEPGDQLFQAIGCNGFFLDSSELRLSRRQQKYFVDWRRPHEAFRDYLVDGTPETNIEPNMVATSRIDLIQDVTADCSVVASLCAAVARSGRSFEKLLSSIFYPYNNEERRPMISGSGRYIFRLHFNGCFRQVVVDDRLPCSNSTRTLHVVDRQNPGLLWPALLEKAYLKIHGGYDFPGSNSGTDLWVLTGWIPEQIFLQRCVPDVDCFGFTTYAPFKSDQVDPQQLWNRIFNSYSLGDVMLSLGTGHLSQVEEEGLGLAGGHNYAVLDVKEFDGQQLVLVKNPWCDGTIWRGANPKMTWSEKLTSVCAGENGAGQIEREGIYPGTFWIAFNQVLRNFDSLYLNWDPVLFRFRQDHHFSWTIRSSVSSACFTHNPQFSISSVKGGPVWVLLSRHFSTEERSVLSSSIHKKEAVTGSPLGFISLYVCDTNGKRIHSGDTILRGPFVDSPQTLIRLDMPTMKCYTLVTAQQDLPLPKYSFTLSVYSRDPVTVDHASDMYPHHKSLLGVWTLRTAGGNASSALYKSNPQYQLSVTSTTDVVLLLETNQPELPVHVSMLWGGGERVTIVTARDIVGESGEYRRGFALAEVPNVLAGTYTVVCSTFEHGQTGSFTLQVESTLPCEVRPIAGEAAGRLSLRVPRVIMHDGVDRMLAPVAAPRLTSIRVVARPCELLSHSYPGAAGPLKVSLERGQGPNKIILASSNNGEFKDAPTGVRTGEIDVGPQEGGRGALWLVVERPEGTKSVEEIEVEILSEAPIEVGTWGTGNG